MAGNLVQNPKTEKCSYFVLKPVEAATFYCHIWPFSRFFWRWVPVFLVQILCKILPRFHIRFYAKCKNVMNVCFAYVDSRKKHFEPPHDKTNKMTFCAQWRLRSAWYLGPNFASGGQRWLWSDWADLSLRWAHISFCWFCHAVVQFSYWNTSETIAYGIVTNLHMRI